MSHRETGWVDDLRTVGALHQGERRVPGVLLIGLFTDLTHCRQRKSWLRRDRRTIGQADGGASASEREPTATYRETLSQHAGLLQLPGASKFLHVSAEVAVSALGPNAGLTALTPAAGRHGKHGVSSECAKPNNSTFNGLNRVTLLIKALLADPDV